MKALKITATFLVAALGLAVGLAAEALALARCTVLDPGFYGAPARGVYGLAGEVAVRRMADAVLENAPAVALRTKDRAEAYALARKALPPRTVSDMLEASGPDVARFLIDGGDLPVLKGASGFMAGEVAVVKGLLMEGLWDMLPQKPSLPAFMPFTPEWNLGYGESLNRSLWLPRWYLGMADEATGLLLSALVLLTGLLYLVWIRERKPFFAVTGGALALNGLLLLAMAAATSYCSRPIAEASAAVYPIGGAAELFGADYAELVRLALWPFRRVFFLSALVSLSFGVTLFTMGISVKPEMTATPGAPGSRVRDGKARHAKRHPKHARGRQ